MIFFAIKLTPVLGVVPNGKKYLFFPNAWFKIPNLRKFPKQTHKCTIIYTCTVKSTNKSINLIFVTWNNANFHASQSYVVYF